MNRAARSAEDRLRALNEELIRMAEFTQVFWNGGARFWLEHRGPELARAVRDVPGLKLWMGVPPDSNILYHAKALSLLADHLVIGHRGPLPPPHLGLAFPWRFDHSAEVPSLEFTEPRAYQIRMDAVRRPLPPVARQCLLGNVRPALASGMATYLPASIIYAPISDVAWPDPAEILSRDGRLPTSRRTVLVDTKTRELSVHESKKDGDPGTLQQLSTIAPDEREGDDGPQLSIGSRGFYESDDPRIYSDVWDPCPEAETFEHLFASYVAGGHLAPSEQPSEAFMRKADALLDVRLPYVGAAPWAAIEEIRDGERDALESLRRALLSACDSVSNARGTASFSSEVGRIQKVLVDKGVRDVEKSFRSKNLRHRAQASGFVIGSVVIQVACWLGLPPLSALPILGVAAERGIKLAMDLRKEEDEWKSKARKDLPMYCVWKLGKVNRGRTA